MKQTSAGNETGFTLIELLSAMALGSLLVGLLFVFFQGLIQITSRTGALLDQRADICLLDTQLRDELENIKVIQRLDQNEIRFLDNRFDPVRIHTDSGQIFFGNRAFPSSEPISVFFDRIERELRFSLSMNDRTIHTGRVFLGPEVVTREP